MKARKPDFELGKTHVEMAVLRMLVESMLTALPPDIRDDVALRFSNQCARLLDELTRAKRRAWLLQTTEVAVAQQMRRLAAAGIEFQHPL